MAEKSPIKWHPIESNPKVMNKYLRNLGLSEDIGFSDVVSMDEEFLDKIPNPTYALLLLFPITPTYTEYWKKQEELINETKKLMSDEDVYFMKQTIANACGTIALIHAVANNEKFVTLHPESTLKEFLVSTKDMTPEERGRSLEKDKSITAAHESSAREGQTETPSIHDELDQHFITFVNINDKLVELDGRKSGPLLYGATTEKTFLKDAVSACKEYMQRDPDNHNFTALAFGAL